MRRSERRQAIAVAIGVLYIINANRGVTPYSWQSFGTFIVVGLSLGGIYAITAGGLVVTYATTGIFNFAHGAIGCFLAFLYWELRVNQHWAAPYALFVVIFVVAPLLGIALDVTLMRRLRNAALVANVERLAPRLAAVFGNVDAAIFAGAEDVAQRSHDYMVGIAGIDQDTRDMPRLR